MEYEYRVFIRGGVRGYHDEVWSPADNDIVWDNFNDAVKSATNKITHNLGFQEAKVVRTMRPDLTKVFICQRGEDTR